MTLKVRNWQFSITWFRAGVDLPEKIFNEKVLFFTQSSYHLMCELLKKSYMLPNIELSWTIWVCKICSIIAKKSVIYGKTIINLEFLHSIINLSNTYTRAQRIFCHWQYLVFWWSYKSSKNPHQKNANSEAHSETDIHGFSVILTDTLGLEG